MGPKETPGLDGGGYVNDALTCSSLDITTPHTDAPHGGLTGSNEFILTEDGKKVSQTGGYLNDIDLWWRQKAQRTFTHKMLHKRIPILKWLPKYDANDAIGDLVAGITVGLTVIPQSLAYAGIAGLPAAYGLYGSFLGCFVYIFFGSCKDVPMGPSAISALLTFQYAGGSIQKAILLSLFTGIIELLMGIFGLGFLVDFVSGPVSSGFTSAVALIIVTSQIKDILGIKAAGATFLEIWSSIFQNVHNTTAWDTCLGITCIIVLLLMRLLVTLKLSGDGSETSKGNKILGKILWFIGTSRNAILVIICGIIGYSFKASTAPFQTIGYIPSGLPSVQVPQFSIPGDETVAEQTFGEMLSSMKSGLIVVPLIALMENISICKAFANGKTVDATQELIAIGLGNIANSFVQGFPGTGSLSRGAVNNASGVRTPFGNLYTSLLVVFALLFFTPYFSYIPKATLAAIIIAAVVFMVEVKVVKPMWRTKKSDLIPGIITFIACLSMPLERGILLGIGVNIMSILYHAARPKIAIETLTTSEATEYLMITPDRCLIFPSVDYVRNLVTKHSIKKNLPVVIDCSHIYGADYTAATVILQITKDFSSRDQPLFFYNLKPSVCSVFEGLSPIEFTVYYQEEVLDELLRRRNTQLKEVLSA